MKIIGSQHRETLKEANYHLLSRFNGYATVLSPDGKRELWASNDHAAGFVLQIGRWGYEFVRELK